MDKMIRIVAREWIRGLEQPTENEMAERKSALKRAPDRPILKQLFERAREIELTDEELRDQRASFVYGNAPRGSRITKESAIESTKRVRITKVTT